MLADVAQLSPQTRRHYASTLLAMNNAKAEGIITHHSLGDMRLPAVKKSDDPVNWTHEELAVITDQWECE